LWAVNWRPDSLSEVKKEVLRKFIGRVIRGRGERKSEHRGCKVPSLGLFCL